MESNKTLEEVIGIVSAHFGKRVKEILPTSSFSESLGADSLDIVELVAAVEEKYGIEIDDDTAENLNTINDLVSYIESRGSN